MVAKTRRKAKTRKAPPRRKATPTAFDIGFKAAAAGHSGRANLYKGEDRVAWFEGHAAYGATPD